MRALQLIGLVVLAAALGQVSVLGQEPPDVDEHPFEVGGHVTSMGINFPAQVVSGPAGSTGSTTLPRIHITTFGIGGRVGYNVNRNVSVEAELNYLPERNFNEIQQSRRVQIFAGVKAGKRWEKFGLFVKARPGAMNFNEYRPEGPCTASFPASPCDGASRTFFAMDVGGVAEYYPTKRTILRVDAGDTIIRFGDAGPITFPPSGTFPGSSLSQPGATSHNFQLSVGFGFRF